MLTENPPVNTAPSAVLGQPYLDMHMLEIIGLRLERVVRSYIKAYQGGLERRDYKPNTSQTVLNHLNGNGLDDVCAAIRSYWDLCHYIAERQVARIDSVLPIHSRIKGPVENGFAALYAGCGGLESIVVIAGGARVLNRLYSITLNSSNNELSDEGLIRFGGNVKINFGKFLQFLNFFFVNLRKSSGRLSFVLLQSII